MAYLQFFPEAFIQLQQEVLDFPDLMRRLSKHADHDAELQFAKMIAEIAAYVNIALEGDYDEPLLIKVAELCIQRLRARKIAIISSVKEPPLTAKSKVGIVDQFGNPIVIH